MRRLNLDSKKTRVTYKAWGGMMTTTCGEGMYCVPGCLVSPGGHMGWKISHRFQIFKPSWCLVGYPITNQMHEKRSPKSILFFGLGNQVAWRLEKNHGYREKAYNVEMENRRTVMCSKLSTLTLLLFAFLLIVFTIRHDYDGTWSHSEVWNFSLHHCWLWTNVFWLWLPMQFSSV